MLTQQLNYPLQIPSHTGYPPEQPSELSESQQKPLDYGINMAKSNVNVRRSTSVYTTYPHGLKRRKVEAQDPKNSSIVGFRPQNKKLIWNVKSSLCEKNTQDFKSYKMSALELIGNDAGLESFFDSACKERSEKLQWQVEIDSQDSDSNLSSFLLKKLGQNSWFTTVTQRLKKTNSPKICFPLSTSSPVGTTESESTQNETKEPPKKRRKVIDRLKESKKTMRCRYVRLKPLFDKEILKKQFGVYRYIYNTCVDLENKGEIDGASSKEMRKHRKDITNKENWQDSKPWFSDLDCHGRQQAVAEFFKNKKENLKRAKQKLINKFTLQKKSKYRSRQECIPIQLYRIRKKGKLLEICYKRKPIGFKILDKAFFGREDEKFIRREIKIVRTRLGAYYACVPIEVTFSSPKTNHICALDPGVRTFQTIYGTDSRVYHVGTSFEKCYEELKKADELESKMKILSTSKKRRNYKYRKRRCFERVRTRIRDLHHKVSSWLTDAYRIIILPEFKSSNMYKKLHSKTCRTMATWSHYKFKEKLLEHGHRKGVKVLIANEAFTSKTCGVCGELNDVGSSKNFKCNKCGMACDRDVNGARNILLRALKQII